MITIGLDPHLDSHTVGALDENGTTLASLTVANDVEGLALLHQLAHPFPEHRWAVEGPANRFILPFVCELLEQQISGFLDLLRLTPMLMLLAAECIKPFSTHQPCYPTS